MSSKHSKHGSKDGKEREGTQKTSHCSLVLHISLLAKVTSFVILYFPLFLQKENKIFHQILFKRLNKKLKKCAEFRTKQLNFALFKVGCTTVLSLIQPGSMTSGFFPLPMILENLPSFGWLPMEDLPSWEWMEKKEESKKC